MKLIYSNDYGKVEMHGTEKNSFSIYKIEGLELLGRERSLVNFHNSDGYYQSAARFGQRVISVSGDIKIRDIKEAESALGILSCPGVLIVSTGAIEREINVNDCTLKFGEQNGGYKKFAVQFTCDQPHFKDCKDNVAGVYVRKNLITAETVLPAIFTSRISEGNVENGGDFPVEPVIYIRGVMPVEEEAGSIIIKNHTNGQRLSLEHKLEEGEQVIIDIPNRQITSDVSGNILNCLSLGSYMSDWKLGRGENIVEVTASGGNRNAEVYIKYRNLYAGVIV